MKRFEFKLQRVLQYRERLEEQAKNRYEQTLVRLHRAQNELAALSLRRLELLAGLELAPGKRVDLLALAFCHTCGSQLRGLILAKSEEIEQHREVSAQALREWTSRRQEAEVIRRIKEKKWTAYQREVDKEEQKAADDNFLAKVARERSVALGGQYSFSP